MVAPSYQILWASRIFQEILEKNRLKEIEKTQADGGSLFIGVWSVTLAGVGCPATCRLGEAGGCSGGGARYVLAGFAVGCHSFQAPDVSKLEKASAAAHRPTVMQLAGCIPPDFPDS